MSLERLLERYSEWRHERSLQFPSPKTTEARILEMKENAGVPGGSGMKYDVMEIDGESFSCPPDGGLGALCDRMGRAMKRDAQMREVDSAIRDMPRHHRTVIEQIYHVPQREKPRSGRQLSVRLGVTRDAAEKMRERALGWLERALVDVGLIVVRSGSEEVPQ